MARTRAIVLEAARKLLVAEGPDAVTALRVSEATGIARTTIYRHWPERTDLLRDAVASEEPESPIELSGDTRDDLIAILTHSAERLARRRGSRMMAVAVERSGLRGEAGGPHREMVRRRMDPLRKILQASIDSGNVSGKLDIDDAVAELAGPPFFQGVLLRRKVTAEFIAGVVDGFLAAHPADS
ncbi:MAG: TetR/AcrR family transcriptional regulator [Actinomycetota bacterium]|nr:TetR/AcrR family transcriptional regulator [Actinomycetota bacterium]